MDREYFLNFVKDLLQSNGFQLESNKYIKKQTIQQPGQQMIINGQVFNNPGPTVNVEFIVEMCGEGVTSNPDGTDEDLFEMIMFNIFENDNCVCDFGQSFCYDDTEDFKHYCQKLFNIN